MMQKVLVADKDAPLVAQVLRFEGFEPIFAKTGRELLEKLAAEHPWLILVDEVLPDMPGEEVVERITAAADPVDRPGVILLTRPQSEGGSSPHGGIGRYRSGPDMYLRKPFNPLELASFLRRLSLQQYLSRRNGQNVTQYDEASDAERLLIRKIAEKAGMAGFPCEPVGVDVFLPLVDKIRAEGAGIVLKMDSEPPDGNSKAYTAVVSGGPLGDAFFRANADSAEDALTSLIVWYARHQWDFEIQDIKE